MTAAWLIGGGIGIAGETLARVLGLWRYRHPVWLGLNIVLMFGLAMGSLALLVPELGYAVTFGAACALGIAYEWLNFLVLDWWRFPDQRFLVFRGRAAIALAVGMLWGAVPLLVYAALRLL